MIKIKCFRTGSSGNCYLVSNQETNILLECGVNNNLLRNILNNNNLLLTNIDGCLVSHSHKDHAESIEYVSQYTNCYVNEETLDKYNVFKGTKIVDNQVFNIKTINCLTFIVKHGETECNAFILNDNDSLILFATDFNYFQQDLTDFEFNEIWIECNYQRNMIQDLISHERDKYLRQPNTHCELDILINYILCKKINLNKCNKIVLIHSSEELLDKENARKKVESKFGIPTYIAKKGGGLL